MHICVFHVCTHVCFNCACGVPGHIFVFQWCTHVCPTCTHMCVLIARVHTCVSELHALCCCTCVNGVGFSTAQELVGQARAIAGKRARVNASVAAQACGHMGSSDTHVQFRRAHIHSTAAQAYMCRAGKPTGASCKAHTHTCVHLEHTYVFTYDTLMCSRGTHMCSLGTQ